jgi:hypothetical protein
LAAIFPPNRIVQGICHGVYCAFFGMADAKASSTDHPIRCLDRLQRTPGKATRPAGNPTSR